MGMFPNSYSTKLNLNEMGKFQNVYSLLQITSGDVNKFSRPTANCESKLEIKSAYKEKPMYSLLNSTKFGGRKSYTLDLW